jgi:EAL domain-containing protein (putative c-di-GMP-specific phosphodiesterase class I)
LRRALDEQELLLYYQPIVDRATMTVSGVEALLRWEHPELGLLAPDHFMIVAERSGVILPIGGWALRRACIEGRALQRSLGRDIVIGVNVSARQLFQVSIVDDVRSALAESGLDASCLELEITETNAMQNVGHSIRVLRQLKSVGVRIAVDDFGTGYSSLNYLAELPIDTIKLDRSFVRDIARPGGGAIALAVIDMAHALRLKVTAEGVEDETHLSFLVRHRCDSLQGYLFARPSEISKLPQLVNAVDRSEGWAFPHLGFAEGEERTH